MGRRYRKNKKKGLVLLILVLVSALSVMLLIGTGYFSVKDIEVEGSCFLSQEKIIELAGIYKGVNIFTIRTGEIERDLKAHPYILNAKVKRDLPSRVLIQVNERDLIGYIPFMGSYLLIDSERKVVSATSNIPVQSIPVFQGIKVKDFELDKVLKVENPQIFDKMYYISKHISRYLSKYVPIIADIGDLQNVMLNLNNKFLLKIGNLDNLDYKLKYGNTILEKLYTKDVSGELDLTNGEKAFFRPW